MVANLDRKRVLRALLRQKISAFTQKTFATVSPGDAYLHNWHVDAISELLQAAFDREIKRFLINVPPRYLKSITVSTAFPAWGLGQDPKLQFMCVSYAESLALKLSLDTRLVMSQPWYQQLFPKTKFAEGQNQQHKFVTTERGYRLATSMSLQVRVAISC
jgi:hypothetical protein